MRHRRRRVKWRRLLGRRATHEGAQLACDATRALDLAFTDVGQAFDAFLAAVPADAPIILAGHSQGALHLTRLLRDRVARKPLAKRIVAAYVVGWPISIAHDLPKLALPACDGPTRSGCVMSWGSYAEPAEPQVEVPLVKLAATASNAPE